MYETALAFSVLCFGAVGFYFLRSPYFSVFHPLTFYTAFHGLLFVFRPILAYALDYQLIYRAFQFTPSASDKLTVILASNLGFLAFAICCLRKGSVPMQFRQDGFSDIERVRLARVFIWVAAICVPIGVYSLATLWYQAVGGTAHSDMVLDSGTGVITTTGTNGYLIEAQLMLASCGAIMAWLFRFKLIAILPLIFFVLFRASTGGRGPFVTAMVTVGLLYLYEQRRKIFTVQAGAAMVAAVLMFNAIGSDRGDSLRRMINNDDTADVFVAAADRSKFLEGMDFGNLEFFEYLVYAIPQRTGTYGYFVDTLQVFTEPVPRALWKDKPIGAPFNKIFLLEYGRPVGMTRSLPGQGWYSLGWAGVVIWCGLWGYLLGMFYRRFATGPQNSLYVITYLIVLPMMIIAFRDGVAVTVARQALFFLGPVMLWALFARQLGVPDAQAMRAAAARRWRQLVAAGAAQDIVEEEAAAKAALPGAIAPARLAHLPPAVARRRLALSRNKGPA